MARRPANEQGNTVARIRAAAFRLFGRFGYDGVSMLTVARESDITKAALYWHYDNKEALYSDCMRRLVGLFEHHVFEPAQREPDPIDRIFMLFVGLERLGADPRVADGVAGYWLRPSTAPAENARALQIEFEQNAETAVEHMLEQAQDAGVLGVGDSARDIGRAFIAIMEGVVLPLGGRTESEQNRLVAVMAHIFFKAHASAPELAERARKLLTQGDKSADTVRLASGHVAEHQH